MLRTPVFVALGIATLGCSAKSPLSTKIGKVIVVDGGSDLSPSPVDSGGMLSPIGGKVSITQPDSGTMRLPREEKDLTSCLDRLGFAPTSPSGVYRIDVDGSAGGVEPVEVFCNQELAGGGWQLISMGRDRSLSPFLSAA